MMNQPPSLRQLAQAFVGLGFLCYAALLCELGGPDDEPMILVSGGIAIVCLLHGTYLSLTGSWEKQPRLGSRKDDPLDHVLLHWDQENEFTTRDLLNGGVAVFGRTGSGKTSSSGKALGNALARLPRSGGLLIAAKSGEDRALWERIFADAGRSDDLKIFSPAHDLRFNFLDYEMQQGGHTRNITKCITVIGETLRSSNTDNRESADFFRKEEERMIFNAVEIVKLATGRVTAPDLHRFVSGAAMVPQQFVSAEWLNGFHNQSIKAAWQKTKTPIEQHDFELAKEYWLGEIPFMADKTRSSIMTGVMGLLHTYNTGLVRELASTSTNFTPDDFFQGKWLLIDMAPSEWDDIGSFLIGGWKYLTQKSVLRRVAGPDANVVTIWADEAQQVLTSFDAHFLAQCRSHQGCMVYLSQSLPGYYAAIGGKNGRDSVDALITNFYTKIFHALGDLETAHWASGLVGRSLQTFTSGSMAPLENPFDELMGRSRYTGSFNQTYESTLQTNAFMHGLRTGGAANGFQCDAVILRSGEPFANGESFLMTSFDQRS